MATGYLTQEAEALAVAIATTTNLQERLPPFYSPSQLATMTHLGVTDLNDAADELRDAGLAALVKTGLSSEGYNFFALEPKHTLYYGFATFVPGELEPESDPCTCAKAVVTLEEAGEWQLQQQLGWPLSRTTLAVASLWRADVVNVAAGETGEPPLGFYKVFANASTRRFARTCG